MGGLAIEKIRDGVEFVPDAAAAFRRADAQVQAELGRGIGVNSTYRSWGKQMEMYENWNAYVGGWGPYPGHSKAVHPSDSFHVSGLALDSNDWRNARIVQILAENGFIRNRLYVPNEDHHFEYIRARDRNYGKTAALAPSKPKEITVKHYHRQDATARKSGRTVVAGGSFWLHTKAGVATSQASNIVGGIGPYTITTHVYAEGTPGDALEVTLYWDQTKTAGPHSGHYVERMVFDREGQIKHSVTAQRGVGSGDAVYVQLVADRDNKGAAKVTVLDSDAYLFTVA